MTVITKKTARQARGLHLIFSMILNIFFLAPVAFITLTHFLQGEDPAALTEFMIHSQAY